MTPHTITVRDLIRHYIPDCELSSALQMLLAVEACRALIDNEAVPNDQYRRAFLNWYGGKWAEMKAEMAAED